VLPGPIVVLPEHFLRVRYRFSCQNTGKMLYLFYKKVTSFSAVDRPAMPFSEQEDPV
jgi:hypothetical protein